MEEGGFMGLYGNQPERTAHFWGPNISSGSSASRKLSLSWRAIESLSPKALVGLSQEPVLLPALLRPGLALIQSSETLTFLCRVGGGADTVSLSQPRHSGLSRARDHSTWPWLTRHRCT